MTYRQDLNTLVNLKQLTHLVVLSRHETFSAASDSIRITQPALSESISKLEAAVGVSLAVRGRHGVQMTEAGFFLADRCQDILTKLDQAIVETRNLSAAARGTVALGIPAGLSHFLSVPLVETVYAEHPEIRLSVIEGMSDEVLRWVDEERIDIGIAYEVSETPDIIAELFMTEEAFLVTAPDNWYAEIGPGGIAVDNISVVELSRLPMATTGARGERVLQEQVSKRYGVQLNIVAHINSHPQIIEMVNRASAYAIQTHGGIHEKVKDGSLALVRIEDSSIVFKSFLIRKRTRVLSQAVKLVDNHARKIAKEIISRHGIIGASML